MRLPLCARIDAEDTRSAAALTNDGWRDIEVLETWVRPCSNWERIVTNVRTATLQDLLVCTAIATHAFRYDRLHADPEVTKDDADHAKAEWVGAALRERPHDCFVANDKEGAVVGFLLCRPETTSFRIDLIAVHEAHRGAGVASRLLGWAMDVYPGRQCVVAATQERNVESRVFYQRRGFRIMKRERSFHKFHD